MPDELAGASVYVGVLALMLLAWLIEPHDPL